MLTSPDFNELLSLFREYEVRSLTRRELTHRSSAAEVRFVIVETTRPLPRTSPSSFARCQPFKKRREPARQVCGTEPIESGQLKGRAQYAFADQWSNSTPH